jgi:chemotaxis protein CheC
MIVFTDLTQLQLDALKEISSIASGNAATSLSSMLGKRIDITAPTIIVEALEKVPEILGGAEEVVTVIHLMLKGRVSGSILFILSPSESLGLINILTNQKKEKIEDLDEIGLSALKELGNIITGYYTTALSHFLKTRIDYSVPGFAYDMLGAILEEILARMSLESQYAVITESNFLVIGDIHKGHLVFIMPPKTMLSIIDALGDLE